MEDVVVYDGDCGICEWSATWIRRNVPNVQVVTHSAYGVTYLPAVWFISIDGRREGARAVAEILQRSQVRVARIVGTVIALPVIRIVAAGAYEVIAKNRSRLSRLFRLKACALPQQ